MPLTVAGLEADLLVLLAPYLLKVGLDATTADGTNDALRIPIRRAARRLGVPLADDATVTDADLAAGVAGTDQETLLDLAELKTLEIIWGNWPEVDQTDGSESQSLSQMADRLRLRIADLKDSLGSVAVDPAAAATPNPIAVGLIRAGRPCYGVPGAGYWDSWGRWCS